MTITHSHRRAGLAALLATGVLLLGACGGDDDDAGDDDATEEEAGGESSANETGDTSIPPPSVDPDAPAADSDFCQGAMSAITASVNPNGGEEGDASLEAAEQLDAPEEIAEAWTNVLSTSREMADLDYTDPEASAQAQAAYEGIADDQAQIITYLQEDCGIDLGAGPTDGSAPPTTGA